MKIEPLSRLVAAVSLALSAAPALHAQTAGAAAPAPEAVTLALLLGEVRELRRAVEQVALTSVAVQVTLHRLSLQHEQVRALTEQASQLEAGIAGSTADIDRARTELAELQERVDHEVDAPARRALLEQRGSLREIIERQTAQEQDLRRRAADVSRLLDTKTGELGELVQRLDELERTMAAPARPRPGPVPKGSPSP